jgi:UDP-N-acetylglucosamine/UDP-N-acetylgalactosamine diphosphorylase
LHIKSKFAIWEVPREEEFSPLKNGLDARGENALTCRRALYAQHVRWLRRAGALVQGGEEEGEELRIEVSPLVSYGGEVYSFKS